MQCVGIDATCDLNTLAVTRRWGKTLTFLQFLLKQMTALIIIFQIELSFIKLQLHDIKMLILK